MTLERMQRGLSKAQLARAAGLDQALVSKIEYGRTRPYPAELRRLAMALGVTDDHAAMLLEEVSTDGDSTP